MNYVAAREFLYNYDFENIIAGNIQDMGRYVKAAKMLPLYLELDSEEISINDRSANHHLIPELLSVALSEVFEYGSFDTILEVACTLLGQFNSMKDIERRSLVFKTFLEKLCSYSSYIDAHRLTDVNQTRLDKIIDAYVLAIKNGVTGWYDNGIRAVKPSYFELEDVVQMDDISSYDINYYLGLIDNMLNQFPSDAYILEEYRDMLYSRLEEKEN